MLENLQYFSILIEAVVSLLGLVVFVKKKKSYGLGVFLTFGIYVFYDLAKQMNLNVSANSLYILFFIASLSMLLSVWVLYNNKNSNNKTKIRRKK